MKIAVLFGSFNPLTNAHVAMLQAAVDHLQADKGLFVATNGQYLLLKMVRKNDAFYLPEAERETIIRRTCADHERLEFWGFELGGAIPTRYGTLCAIQKQYPDAQLYEVQGADKVRSVNKSRHAKEYLSHIRFVVFCRNGIDLPALFATEKLLRQHQDAFTILPALGDEAAISSTAVRERFYAGEDYTDLVPAASVDVLSGYQPSDFSIPFEARMRVIMDSGRFGLRKAAREVYDANAALFREWAQGTSTIDFGDRTAYLDNTKLYTTAYTVADQGTLYPTTQTGCLNIDCVDLAEHLIAQGYNPAILNLASAKRPGGGYDQGYAAQEESLCHSSNLSLSLYQYANPNRLKCVRDSGVPLKWVGYPLDMNYGGIYTPNVTFFRRGRSACFAMRDHVFHCDVMTVAALSFNGRTQFAGVTETVYRSASGGFTPEGEAIMLNKIRTIFRMGVEHGKDALVLGAFGCGAYDLPVPDVVRLFRTVMEEPEFAHKFRLITFAILERPGTNVLQGKFGDFYREFGSYSLT